MNNPYDGFDVIYTYTREQAIEEGVLINVSEMAEEAGFRWPVAVTVNVWVYYIIPDDDSRSCGQSEDGRLWDLLTMLRLYSHHGGEIVTFKVYFLMQGNKKKLVTLKAVAGPGDNGEPVITVMLPDED